MIAQRDAVDPFHGQDVMRGAIPVDRGHAKIRIVAGVLRHLRQRRGLQPQIHLHRHRARHRVDDLDQPQPPRFRRIGFGLVRDKEEIGEVAAEARGDIGPQHLHRNRFAHAVALGFAAMHLRDRGGGDRAGRSCKRLRHRAFQRLSRSRLRPRLCENGGSRSCRLSRSRAIIDADHVGPRGQKLSELEIGRPEPRQRARQPRAGFGAGALDQPREPQRELPGRRHQATDRPRRTRLRARTRNRRGRAARCGSCAEITNASPNATPRCRPRGSAR